MKQNYFTPKAQFPQDKSEEELILMLAQLELATLKMLNALRIFRSDLENNRKEDNQC